MSPSQRIFRFVVAGALGIAVGLLMPVPGFVVPTLAVATFTLSCFALRCLSLWVTFAFTLLIGGTPILAFTFGYWSHAPLLESLLVPVEGFVRHFQLVVAFFLAPLAVAALLHVVLRRIGVWHVQA
jgi:hypothetical protein